MTTNQFGAHEWADQHRRALKTRHTHQDALTDREFERLLEGCEKLPESHRFETRCICLLAGRLGLRAGEITHLTTDWLDWNRKLVRIPQFEPCTSGYCRRQARQEAHRNDSLTIEQAQAARWHPKTAASERVIPFDLSLRVELCLKRFADQYDAFPRSRDHQQTGPRGCYPS